MTCRHKDPPNNPDCSSYIPQKVRVQRLRAELEKELSPDSSRFEIDDVIAVGPHLVVKAKFPNCAKCAYEGVKVLVYLNTDLKAAIRWRRLDPHFRAEKPATSTEAPSPSARFPASEGGWQDALAWAQWKVDAAAMAKFRKGVQP